MYRFSTSFALILFGLASAAASQESCDAILVNGYKNIEISKGLDSSIATKYFNYCRTNLNEASKDTIAQASVEVFGSGAGSGSFEQKEATKKLEDWCETNKEAAQRNQSKYQESQQISAAAVNAWTTCKSIMRQEEVDITPVISEDLQSVRIAVKYRGSSPAGVRLFAPLLTNWTCSTEDPNGSVLGFSREIYVRGEPASVSCKRQGHNENYARDNQQYDYWPASNINIQIGSRPFGIDFQPIFSPSLPKADAELLKVRLAEIDRMTTPVGAVVPFFLTPMQVRELGPSWLPADGRVVEDTLSPLYGATLPNLGGRYVRGSQKDQDVVGAAVTSAGGSENAVFTGTVTVATSDTTYYRRGPINDNMGGPFTVDTSTRETQVADHSHNSSGSVTVQGEINPLHQDLVYLVRVR